MAVSAGETILTYPVSDTVNNQVVTESLLTELEALALSELVPKTVDEVAGNIKLGLDYTPGDGADLSGDITLISAAVAAHQGEPIGTSFQKLTEDGDVLINTLGVDQIVAELQTDALKAGEYMVFWTIELQSTDPAFDGAIRCQLFSNSKAEENLSGIFRHVLSSQASTTRQAGQKVTIRVRIDLNAGAVTVRNLRMQVLKVPENGS